MIDYRHLIPEHEAYPCLVERKALKRPLRSSVFSLSGLLLPGRRFLLRLPPDFLLFHDVAVEWFAVRFHGRNVPALRNPPALSISPFTLSLCFMTIQIGEVEFYIDIVHTALVKLYPARTAVDGERGAPVVLVVIVPVSGAAAHAVSRGLYLVRDDGNDAAPVAAVLRAVLIYPVWTRYSRSGG